MEKRISFPLLQVYGPCMLLVVISWVSFWLNREATSDRISLSKMFTDESRERLRCSGITTVLTMTFMGLEARKDLPKVTYPTALDYFVFISFMYIFCTVVQVRPDRDSLSAKLLTNYQVWPGPSFHQDRLGRILS